MKKVIVVPYDESWKHEYELIKAELLCVIDNCIITIEHVGIICVRIQRTEIGMAK